MYRGREQAIGLLSACSSNFKGSTLAGGSCPRGMRRVLRCFIKRRLSAVAPDFNNPLHLHSFIANSMTYLISFGPFVAKYSQPLSSEEFV